MKRSIDAIVEKRCLPLFCYLTLATRCLRDGFSELINIGSWTIAINGDDGLERCGFDKLCRGLITAYLNQPEPNLHKRSGERMRLAVLSI